MYITHTPDTHDGWLIKQSKEVAIEDSGVGLLEVHICRRCGAVEWGCIDVENIPIGPHTMTELVAPGDDEGPYR